MENRKFVLCNLNLNLDFEVLKITKYIKIIINKTKLSSKKIIPTRNYNESNQTIKTIEISRWNLENLET